MESWTKIDDVIDDCELEVYQNNEINPPQERVMAPLKRALSYAAVGCFMLASSARAHYVWLKRDSDGASRVYFGEWQLDIREKAGGLLEDSGRPCQPAPRHTKHLSR